MLLAILERKTVGKRSPQTFKLGYGDDWQILERRKWTALYR